MNQLREQVRRHYAQAATVTRTTGCCAGPGACGPEQEGFGAGLYGAEAADVTAQVLSATGFEDIQITPTHEVADHMHAAVIRARRT